MDFPIYGSRATLRLPDLRDVVEVEYDHHYNIMTLTLACQGNDGVQDLLKVKLHITDQVILNEVLNGFGTEKTTWTRNWTW